SPIRVLSMTSSRTGRTCGYRRSRHPANIRARIYGYQGEAAPPQRLLSPLGFLAGHAARAVLSLRCIRGLHAAATLSARVEMRNAVASSALISAINSMTRFADLRSVG